MRGVPAPVDGSDRRGGFIAEESRNSRMKRNVGRIDAAVRVVAGVAVAVLAVAVALGAVSVPVFSAVGLALAGVVLVVEGATRRCLLYRVLGIDRCPVD